MFISIANGRYVSFQLLYYYYYYYYYYLFFFRLFDSKINIFNTTTDNQVVREK